MKNHLAPILAAIGTLAAAGAGAVDDPPDYAVHEWGTFTSVQGSDGESLRWNPFETADLPGFVFDRHRPSGGLSQKQAAAFQMLDLKSSTAWLQRMETPVIYFHSREELTVDVEVEFPNGLLTEWFPQVTSFGPVAGAPLLLPDTSKSHLRWDDIKVLAGNLSQDKANLGCLPIEAGQSHYYPARQTSANLIESTRPLATEPRLQRDRFLFYRGVGSFVSPLRVSMPGNDQVEVRNLGEHPLGPLFVVRHEGNQLTVKSIHSLAAGDQLRVSLPFSTTPDEDQIASRFEQLEHEIRTSLTAAGLHADEAAAMLATWRTDWLHDQGVRVLYLLPRPWTDSVLPLRIHPAPTSLVRVMVGRADIFAPKLEEKVASLVREYDRGNEIAALNGLRELRMGRLLEPAITRAAVMVFQERFADLLPQTLDLGNAETPDPRDVWRGRINVLKQRVQAKGENQLSSREAPLSTLASRP